VRFRLPSRTGSVDKELPAGRAEVPQLKGSACLRGGRSRFFAEAFLFEIETFRINRRFPLLQEMRHQGETK
jgi:hypothetical protein